MIYNKTQIVATIGPASTNKEILKEMINNGMSIARLNLSWGDFDEHGSRIKLIRETANELNINIPIILDLPGPRIQEDNKHTYDKQMISCITEKDKESIKFAVKQEVEYVALSFVGNKGDVEEAKSFISENSGKQKIISKIERIQALDNLEEIILSSDGIMIARGDLGDELPFEQVPIFQTKIIELCRKYNKPVITATEMLLSMTDKKIPSRGEVTDVFYAGLLGTSATMLSEESARGKYPVSAVEAMKRILLEVEKQTPDLKRIAF